MSKLERKGWNWAAVPSEVILSDLTDSAARIYSYLVWRAGTSGSAFPKVETIAKDTRRSEPTVKRALKELVAKNWVYRYRRVGGSSMTFIFERQADCIEFKNDPANSSKVIRRGIKGDTTEVSQVIRVNESHFNESHLNKTTTTAAAKKVEKKPDPVITCYETNIGAATSVIVESVAQWRNQGIENVDTWMIEAISEAVKNGVRKWAYVEKILGNWATNGYKADKRTVKENKYPTKRPTNTPATDYAPPAPPLALPAPNPARVAMMDKLIRESNHANH